MDHGILKVVRTGMLDYGCESVISRADSSEVRSDTKLSLQLDEIL